MFKRLFHWFKEEFELSFSETKDIRNFTLLLVTLAALSLLVPYAMESTFDKIVIEKYGEEAATKQKQWVKKKKKDIAENSSDSMDLDFFDPNTVDIQGLIKMGFPKRAASNLVNFRNKGMVYRSKEDVAKVYGIDSILYSQIEPFINLSSKKSREDYTADKIIYEKAEDKKPRPIWTYKRPDPFDINTASVAQLIQVKGIGEVFANRIIKYRDELGGFHSVKQVKKTYNLSEEAYDSLAVVAIISTTHKKFNINSIEIGEFKHPTLKYFQIKGIVNYRMQHGDFKSFKDLKKLKVLNSETLLALKPYISFAD